MNKMGKQLALFSRHYKILYLIMGITWGLFICGVIIAQIFGSGYTKLSMYTGLFSSMMTLIIIVPFMNQFMVFPYTVALGWTREEYLKTSIVFNFLLSITFITFLNLLVSILGLPSYGFIILETASLFYELVYMGIAMALTLLSSSLGLAFYRHGAMVGVSIIFLTLSPVMYFRYKITDILKWSQTGISIAVLILLIFGILCGSISYFLISKTEVRA